MNILGINAYHGDVSAVLLSDGDLVAAIEEERFARIKHVAGFPTRAIQECLRIGGLTGRDIHHVAISRDPRAHAWRKVLFAARRRPGKSLVRNRAANYGRVREIPKRVGEILGVSSRMPATHWVEHHPAHLASAFFASPFDAAAVCAVDGFGDFVSTSVARGHEQTLDVVERTFFPHSLGLLYLAITQHLGFTRYGDEYKVMGLAPYGQPACAKELGRLICLNSGGAFELDLRYFCHWSGGSGMTWESGEPTIDRVFSPALEELIGPARTPDEPLTSRHHDIAASLQHVFETALWHVLQGAAARLKSSRLCLAGGCAMNSVANGKVRVNTPFTDVWVQPAAGDHGTSLGAALWVWHRVLGQPRRFVMRHGYWGTAFDAPAIAAAVQARHADLAAASCDVRQFCHEAELTEWTAHRVASGDVVGWFQGRMEWGARALGNRSILADPRRTDMRDIINTRIKLRESFRPFAPSVVEEACADYFEGSADPFMMQVATVRSDKRSVIPAVTHVDGSARPQIVRRDDNPRYWSLLRAVERETGVPMVLNTSFNENEPIVQHPSEALDCFLRTQMDALVLGDTVVSRPARRVTETRQ